MAKVAKTWKIEEEVFSLVKSYAVERNTTIEAAAGELLERGWVSAHQDILCNPVISAIKTSMLTIGDVMVASAEEVIDEASAETAVEIDALRRLVLTSMAMDGKLEDADMLAEALEKADMALEGVI